MSRTFAYCRVSTPDQTFENQILEIERAGFVVEPRRIITETISGAVAAAQRPGFAKLLDRLEDQDVLIVTKLDRLGRNAMDVRASVEALAKLGVRVHCLALGGVDRRRRGIRTRSPDRTNSSGAVSRQGSGHALRAQAESFRQGSRSGSGQAGARRLTRRSRQGIWR